MKRFTVFAAFFILLLLFICFPHTVSNGAAAGLMLWFEVVIPALLPFLLFAVFFFRLGVTDFVSSLLYPVFHALYGISKGGCYPALIGFLSGYPLGAKMTADTYIDGRIEREEAQYILSFCNNASPMFPLEYVGIQCTSSKIPYLFWICVTLSAFLGARFDLFFLKRKDKTGCGNILNQGRQENENSCTNNVSVMKVLDRSIMECCETLVKIGGYMILFSVLLALLQQVLPIGVNSGCFLAAIFEITTGANAMKQCAMPVLMRNSILCGFCAFGGLSSVFQTASVVKDAGLSMFHYILVKVRQAVIAAIIYYILSSMFLL